MTSAVSGSDYVDWQVLLARGLQVVCVLTCHCWFSGPLLEPAASSQTIASSTTSSTVAASWHIFISHLSHFWSSCRSRHEWWSSGQLAQPPSSVWQTDPSRHFLFYSHRMVHGYCRWHHLFAIWTEYVVNSLPHFNKESKVTNSVHLPLNDSLTAFRIQSRQPF